MGSLGSYAEVAKKKTSMWLQPKVNGAIPSQRWGHSACYSNASVYIFGGCCGGMHFSDVLVLNLETMAWNVMVTRGQGPGPRDSHSAVVIGHKMIVFGGTNGSDKVNDVHMLDIQSKEWTNPECEGIPPSPRESHTATLVCDEKLVIFGGSGEGEANYLNDLHVLDLKTMKWSSPEVKGKIPVPRDSHSAVAIGNRLFLYGGDSGDRYQGSVDVLDTETFTWSKLDVLGPSPSARAGHASVNFGTKIYVIGGVGEKQYYNDVWVLDIVTCSWTQLDICGQKPQGRFSHTAVVTNLSIVIYGGCGEDERPLNELLILQLGVERTNGAFNLPVYKTSSGNPYNQGSKRFLRGDNDLQKPIFVDIDENVAEKDDHELKSSSKPSILTDSFNPKRRRINNLKTNGVESEAEEHSLSLSQHSSPSQSDQEQTPAKKATDSVQGPQLIHLLQQQKLTRNSFHTNHLPLNQPSPKISLRASPDELRILGEHLKQPHNMHTINDVHTQEARLMAAEEQKSLEAGPFENLVGAEVHGKVDVAFDSGYLMTAVVNGRTFRGVLFPPGPNHVPRVANHGQRSLLATNAGFHQVNPCLNHAIHNVSRRSPETRPIHLRRLSPVIRSSTSLDADSKHNKSELQGVVLTLGGPGIGNGRS